MSGDLGQPGPVIGPQSRRRIETPDSDISFDTERCLQLLADRAFGRLSFSARALPAITPVRYWLGDEQIFLRLSSEEWLPHLERGQVVLLQVDHIAPESSSGWQVTATGKAVSLDGRGEAVFDGAAPHLALHPQLLAGSPIRFS